MDDTGIRLEPISREAFLQNPDATKIEFRLRIMDPKKRVNKHKENEAIQFDFDTKLDDFDEMSHEMCKSGLIFDEDVRPVAKLLKIQVQTLLKDRSERQTQIRLEKEQKQQKLLAEQRQKQFAEQLAMQQAAQAQAAAAQAQVNQIQNHVTPTHQQATQMQQQQGIDPAQMLQWQQQQNILMQQNLAAAVQQQQQQTIQNIPVNDVPGQITIEVPVLKQPSTQQMPTQVIAQPVQMQQQQITVQNVPQQVQAPQYPTVTPQMPVNVQQQQQQQQPVAPTQYVQMQVPQVVPQTPQYVAQTSNVTTPQPQVMQQQQQLQQQKPLEMTPTTTGQPPVRKISDQSVSASQIQQQQVIVPQQIQIPQHVPQQVQPNSQSTPSSEPASSGKQSTGTSTPTTASTGGSTASKRPSKSRRVNNSAERNPKLVVLSVEGGTLVECQMENKPKTITFKFDIIDVNPVDVAKNLVSTVFDLFFFRNIYKFYGSKL